MADQHTLYKLIILYMLRRLDFPLSLSQISDFILGKGYTTYFTFQTAMSELEEAKLIEADTTQSTTYYTLTAEGEKTIGFFENRISSSIRKDIVTYIEEHQLEMRDDSSVLASYFKNTSGDFDVRCQVKENDSTLIDLTLSVPTEQQARAIAAQWKKKCQGIYAYLMEQLMVG